MSGEWGPWVVILGFRAWGRGDVQLWGSILSPAHWRQRPEQAPGQQHHPQPARRRGRAIFMVSVAPWPSHSPTAASKLAWEQGSTSALCKGAHGIPGWGSTLLWVLPPPALLTHRGSICNCVRPHSSTAAGERHLPTLQQDVGHASQAGICSSMRWDMGGSQKDAGMNQEKL